MNSYHRRRIADALLLGPQRRRLSMDRRLNALHGDFEAMSPVQRPRRSRSWWRTLTWVSIAGVMSAAFFVVRSHDTTDGGTQPLAGAVGSGGYTGAPTVKLLSSTARLLPAPAAASSSDSYRLLGNAQPVMFEPCRPIPYVVRGGDQPAMFDRMFAGAVAEVSAATGLKFVPEGPTSEVPQYSAKQRAPYQPGTYGDRWASVFVAWSDPSENPELAGGTLGFGGPEAWGTTKSTVHAVSGMVAFDVPDLQLLLHRPHGRTLVHEVMLHELGHLVGLAHVKDKGQVMFPDARPIAHYSRGDLAGLAKLGAGSCYRDY